MKKGFILILLFLGLPSFIYAMDRSRARSVPVKKNYPSNASKVYSTSAPPSFGWETLGRKSAKFPSEDKPKSFDELLRDQIAYYLREMKSDKSLGEETFIEKLSKNERFYILYLIMELKISQNKQKFITQRYCDAACKCNELLKKLGIVGNILGENEELESCDVLLGHQISNHLRKVESSTKSPEVEKFENKLDGYGRLKVLYSKVEEERLKNKPFFITQEYGEVACLLEAALKKVGNFEKIMKEEGLKGINGDPGANSETS